MPIDPRLYRKYTGKMPGEAMNRYGEALAQSAKEKSESKAATDRSFAERYFITSFKWQVWTSILGALGILIVMLTSFWR